MSEERWTLVPVCPLHSCRKCQRTSYRCDCAKYAALSRVTSSRSESFNIHPLTGIHETDDAGLQRGPCICQDARSSARRSAMNFVGIHFWSCCFLCDAPPITSCKVNHRNPLQKLPNATHNQKPRLRYKAHLLVTRVSHATFSN